MFNSLYYLWVEYVQAQDVAWDYFKDIVNHWDLANFFAYLMFFVVRVGNATNITIIISTSTAINQEVMEDHNYFAFLLRFLSPVIMFLKFVKILFILRVFQYFGETVGLIVQCVYDLKPFMILYIIWVIFFANLYELLGVKDEYDPTNGEFEALPYKVRLFFASLRTSIGDL